MGSLLVKPSRWAQGVVGALGDDAHIVVGDDGHVLAGGKSAQGRHHGGGQDLLPQHAADAALDCDGPGPAGLAQPEVLRHRHDAGGGPAGGQHDGDALGQGGVQGGPGAGRDLLLVVGEGAVQIEGQHLDIMVRHRKRFSFSLIIPFLAVSSFIVQ